MRDDRHDDLTPAERDALAALPREASPGDLLEERTVRALRAEGLLGARRRRGWLLTPARAAMAAAAVLALALGGYALGRQAGAAAGAGDVASGVPGGANGGALGGAVNGSAPLTTAADVQRAGSAYIAALARLPGAAAGPDSAAALQGREVAIATLLGAAQLLMRMEPDQPLARDLLAGLDPSHSARSDTTGAARRDIVWF